MTNFNQQVFDVVRRIPVGKVTTYGQIAVLAGNRHASRAVGYALHQIKEEDHLPWQRVVFKDGSLAFGKEQYQLLKAEGVTFDRSRKVKLQDCLWGNEEAEESLWW